MSQTFREAYVAAYADLLRLAKALVRLEVIKVSEHTLAHNFYLEVEGRPDLKFESREAFMGFARIVMRTLLVNMARMRRAKKRGVEAERLETDGPYVEDGFTPESMYQMIQAFAALQTHSARMFAVAMMLSVDKLEIPEVAKRLGIAELTVKRDWSHAKVFIMKRLGRDPSPDGKRNACEPTGLPEATA